MHARVLLTIFGVSILALVSATRGSADEATVSYALAAGACSKPIAVPANNKPVHVLGTQINFYAGVGEVALLRLGAAGHQLYWEGSDLFAGRESGSTVNPNVHIMYLDSTQGKVDVQTAGSGYVKVCNAADNSYSPVAGYLTFLY